MSLSEKGHEVIEGLTPRLEEPAEGWAEVVDVDEVYGLAKTIYFV